MVDPIGGVKEGFHVARFFTVGAGREADGEENQREARGETALHHQALVLGLIVRALGSACDSVVGCRRNGGRGSVRAVLLAGRVAFDVGSGGEGLVGVNADDADLGRQVREPSDFSGVDVCLVDGGGIRGGVTLGEKDAVGLAAGDKRVGISTCACAADGAGVGSFGSGGG